jgi:hypothetical protein
LIVTASPAARFRWREIILVDAGHDLKRRLIDLAGVPRDCDIFAFGKRGGRKHADHLADDIAARRQDIRRNERCQLAPCDYAM